jgi:GNAT superfamily N-acetyltransferase
MSKITHQAFLDLEEALAGRMRNSWRRHWNPLAKEILQLTAQGKFDEAHKVADSIDAGLVFDHHRAHARTLGMSALLLGASRIRGSIRNSRIAKTPPTKQLDAYLAQFQIMLARNATDALRQKAHAWIYELENERLLKFDPSQSRHPAGTPEGGQWVNMKVETYKSGKQDKVRITVRNPNKQKQDPAYIEADVLPDALQLRWTLVAEQWVGAGLGVRMYAKLADYAHAKGLPLISDTAVSPDAQRMYTALAKRGYTVVSNPEAFAAKDSTLRLPKEAKDPWVYRVTKPFEKYETVEKAVSTEIDHNQVKISVAGEQYFGIASSVQVSRLSALGFLMQAEEDGIEYYEVSAVLDEKTCAVCQHMDGWSFPVSSGVQLATQIMETDDPEALKAIAPFYAQNKQGIADLPYYGTDDWVERGMHLPPYHPLCRCIVIPSETPADLHFAERSDRVAVAAQTLYGEGDGSRLTRTLFGIDELPEELTTVTNPADEVDLIGRLQELLSTASDAAQFLPEKNVAPRASEDWVSDLVEGWTSQPAAAVPLSRLVAPRPFEGTTIPRRYEKPFDPKKLAITVSLRWPLLAGILGWMAQREQPQPGPGQPGARYDAYGEYDPFGDYNEFGEYDVDGFD